MYLCKQILHKYLIMFDGVKIAMQTLVHDDTTFNKMEFG